MASFESVHSTLSYTHEMKGIPHNGHHQVLILQQCKLTWLYYYHLLAGVQTFLPPLSEIPMCYACDKGLWNEMNCIRYLPKVVLFSLWLNEVDLWVVLMRCAATDFKNIIYNISETSIQVSANTDRASQYCPTSCVGLKRLPHHTPIAMEIMPSHLMVSFLLLCSRSVVYRPWQSAGVYVPLSPMHGHLSSL